MKRNSMKMVIKILEKAYPVPNFGRSDPFINLIETVLSQRTLDNTTDRVSENLFSIADSPRKMSKLSEREIGRIIRPINFYRTKARRIKEIASIIQSTYGGVVPKSREELIKLPGVGPKTADIVMAYSYGKNVIAIDTHVEVITKRLGVAEEKDDYSAVQKKLAALVPKSKQREINYLFVEHGKKICKKHMPRCALCPIKKYCRYYSNLLKK